MISKTLVCASDNALADRLPLYAIRMKDGRTGFVLQKVGNLPCEVESVLDAGVRAKAIEWGMSVDRIAKAEATRVRRGGLSGKCEFGPYILP